MLRPGLVSITFRQLTAPLVADLAAAAGLEAVEWGGDVHAPHGDLKTAAEVRRLTADRGLEVAAYGSYYRAAAGGPTFESALASAVELGAPVIRVWAGNRPSADADRTCRDAVAKDLRRIAALAADESVEVALEFHAGTLTDTCESAMALLRQAGHTNLKSYWQPPRGRSLRQNLCDIEALRPHLGDVHVFHWSHDPPRRHALADGQADWMQYLRAIDADSLRRFAMIEFVKDDRPENLAGDAQTLLAWLKELRV